VAITKIGVPRCTVFTSTFFFSILLSTITVIIENCDSSKAAISRFQINFVFHYNYRAVIDFINNLVFPSPIANWTTKHVLCVSYIFDSGHQMAVAYTHENKRTVESVEGCVCSKNCLTTFLFILDTIRCVTRVSNIAQIVIEPATIILFKKKNYK